MKQYPCSLVKESAASQHQGGRYHPARVLRWKYGRRKYRAVLGAGGSDEVGIFRAGGQLIVVSRNNGIGYVGAESYQLDPGGEADAGIGSARITVTASHDVFFQSANDALAEYCPTWEDCSLRHLARVLADWLY